MAPRPPSPSGTAIGDWGGGGDWGTRPGAGNDTSVGIGTGVNAFRPNGVDIQAWVEAYNMAGKLGTAVGEYNPDSTVLEY